MERVCTATEPALNLRDFLAQYQKKLFGSADDVPFYLQTNPVLVDVGESCSLDLIESPDDSSIAVFQPGTDHIYDIPGRGVRWRGSISFVNVILPIQLMLI